MTLYERLISLDDLQRVDLMLVMAGRMERKQYGLDLFRAGLAPRLVLSVGRFEVSKMRWLDLPGFQDLVQLRDRTPPDERHFFMSFDSFGVRIQKAKLARWNTYGEALAFRKLISQEQARTVMVISTDVHLRRVALTFRRVCRDMPVQFVHCPVPSELSSVTKHSWWTRSRDRRFVLKEAVKLIGYKVILLMPDWVVHRLMPLKTDLAG